MVTALDSGQSGPSDPRQLMLAGSAGLGARGMTFSEYGAAGGRVLVATGAMSWAAGRPIQPRHQDLSPPAGPAGPGRRGSQAHSSPPAGAGGALRPAPVPEQRPWLTPPRTSRAEQPTWEVAVADLPDGMARQLHGRGLERLLCTRVVAGSRLIGGLHAYFADAAPLTPEHHAMLAFVASLAAHVRERAEPPATAARAADRDLVIAVTGHELRTPLTVIKGFADTLDNHWDALQPEGRREAVRVIGQRADDLARLVDRLLATATAADPGIAMPGPFDLVTALREAVDEMESSLRGRLRMDLPQHLPKAYGDRGTLGTVLTELVTNAAKYSSGQVEVTAGGDEQTVFYRIADRGTGIAAGHVERAFERYWQADSGDRREFSGVGLGLYLVRRIVERQHGWVYLRPRERGGTVAEVRLPRADVTETGEA
jgi:signal transduction histidine kinase